MYILFYELLMVFVNKTNLKISYNELKSDPYK